MELANDPGVYIIVNKRNNKIYIGSTVDIRSRIRKHFSELNKGVHCNDYLQKAFNKEPNMFSVDDVFYMDKSLIRDYEFTLIEILKPEYNLTNYCDQKAILSKETRLKISKSNLNPSRAAKLAKLNRPPVTMYDTSGNFIKSFDFMYEAAQYLNRSVDSINESIYNKRIIDNKYFAVIGGQCCKLPEDQIIKRYNYTHVKKSVNLYKKDEFLGTFESTTDISKFLNKHRSLVQCWKSGTKKSRDGYMIISNEGNY